MVFIFWQNVISIHQSAFLKALAENHEVILVAQYRTAKHRETEKWHIPSMGKVKTIVSPTQDEVSVLLNRTKSYHVFSGIDAFPAVYKIFKLAIQKKLSVSILAEPYNSSGWKGLLRNLKYKYLALKYSRYISHFFATGDIGVKCYKKAGFPMKKLHQWGYFTEAYPQINISNKNKTLPSIIFVGQIIERKNIIPIVKRVRHYKHLFSKFIIIGTGLLQDDLCNLIEHDDKILYIGPIANTEIHKWISNNDLLILPSLFDGWGAVINEALMLGTRVLCSDNCGARVLLDGSERGGTFSLNKNDFDKTLKYWLLKGPISENERKKIADWASENISGTYAAAYFYEVIKGNNVQPRWLNNKLL